MCCLYPDTHSEWLCYRARLVASSALLTRGPGQAVALVLVDQVDAAAPVLAGVALALIHLKVADEAGVPRVAVAVECGDAVTTLAMVAGLGVAVVYILLAQWARKTCQVGWERGQGSGLAWPHTSAGNGGSSWRRVPSAHSHSYPLGRSMHLAPLWQGVLAHSSLSTWHMSPLKPKERRPGWASKNPSGVDLNGKISHNALQHLQKVFTQVHSSN